MHSENPARDLYRWVVSFGIQPKGLAAFFAYISKLCQIRLLDGLCPLGVGFQRGAHRLSVARLGLGQHLLKHFHISCPLLSAGSENIAAAAAAAPATTISYCLQDIIFFIIPVYARKSKRGNPYKKSLPPLWVSPKFFALQYKIQNFPLQIRESVLLYRE